MQRVIELNNGDIFELMGKVENVKNNFTMKKYTLQFEDKLFHEVEFVGYDEYMQSIWDRTGVSFNVEEVNSL